MARIWASLRELDMGVLIVGVGAGGRAAMEPRQRHAAGPLIWVEPSLPCLLVRSTSLPGGQCILLSRSLEAFSIEHFKFWRVVRCHLVQCYLLKLSDSRRRNDD